MRLLNVNTLQLEWFSGDQKPAYAILSHTWGAEEIMLQDVPSLRTGQGAGFSKTRAACEESRRRGFNYVWVDTCCIDKTSSAELSEAINSMFKWYENSDICFAYLDDVPVGSEDIGTSMRKSRWFTRGWTLQELLAPKELIFFASDWSVIGTRHEYASIVSDITGIEQKYLESQDTINTQARQVLISSATVAQRMDWASKRMTTRGEDMSYCLLGLFGINIPLLYGEGSERAFFRLQEAIVRDPTVFDVTLLAWDIAREMTSSWQVEKPSYWTPAFHFLIRVGHPWYHLQPPKEEDDIRGLFARSIHSFSGSQELVLVEADIERSLTDRGLSIKLPVSNDSHPYLILPCRMNNDPWRLLAIPILRQGPNMYARTSQETPFIEHDVWSRWEHRQFNLMTRLKDLPFRPFETLLAATHTKPAQLSLSIPSRYLDFAGIKTSTGWSRQHDPANTILVPYHPRKKNSFGWTVSGTFECVTALLLQTRGTGTRFTVLLEANETHWLLKPFKGPISMSVCFRPDLSTFQEIDRTLQDSSHSNMASWSYLTQDDLVISCSSFSRLVTSLPTVSVGVEVCRSSGWVTWVKSISYGIQLFAEFHMNMSFPAWFSLLMLWKGPTEADKDAMIPAIFDPFMPAAIPMLFWFTALHQDIPVVSQLFPSTSHFIRHNRCWLAVIIAIIGLKATSSPSVFNVMSAVTMARLVLHYYKHPNRELYLYHAEVMTSFMFMVLWAVATMIEMKYTPHLFRSNKSILDFMSSMLLLVTHTSALFFYYFTFSL